MLAAGESPAGGAGAPPPKLNPLEAGAGELVPPKLNPSALGAAEPKVKPPVLLGAGTGVVAETAPPPKENPVELALVGAVAAGAPPKENPPVDGAVAGAGAPPPNENPPVLGAAGVAGAAPPPNENPPVEAGVAAAVEVDPPKLNPPELAVGAVGSCFAPKENPDAVELAAPNTEEEVVAGAEEAEEADGAPPNIDALTPKAGVGAAPKAAGAGVEPNAGAGVEVVAPNVEGAEGVAPNAALEAPNAGLEDEVAGPPKLKPLLEVAGVGATEVLVAVPPKVNPPVVAVANEVIGAGIDGADPNPKPVDVSGAGAAPKSPPDFEETTVLDPKLSPVLAGVGVLAELVVLPPRLNPPMGAADTAAVGPAAEPPKLNPPLGLLEVVVVVSVGLLVDPAPKEKEGVGAGVAELTLRLDAPKFRPVEGAETVLFPPKLKLGAGTDTTGLVSASEGCEAAPKLKIGLASFPVLMDVAAALSAPKLNVEMGADDVSAGLAAKEPNEKLGAAVADVEDTGGNEKDSFAEDLSEGCPKENVGAAFTESEALDALISAAPPNDGIGLPSGTIVGLADGSDFTAVGPKEKLGFVEPPSAGFVGAKRDLAALDSPGFAGGITGLGRDFGVSAVAVTADVAGVVSLFSALVIVMGAIGAAFSFSATVTFFTGSALLPESKLDLGAVSFAGFILGLALSSSSLLASSFLTLSSFLRLSSFRSSLVTTRSVFLEYLVGLLIEGTLCFLPVIWTMLSSFLFWGLSISPSSLFLLFDSFEFSVFSRTRLLPLPFKTFSAFLCTTYTVGTCRRALPSFSRGRVLGFLCCETTGGEHSFSTADLFTE